MIRKKWRGIVIGCMMLGAGISIAVSPCYGEEEDGIEYEYDELNRVVQAVYPDGTTVEYHYDENGNLLETTVIPPEDASASDPNGGSTSDSGNAGGDSQTGSDANGSTSTSDRQGEHTGNAATGGKGNQEGKTEVPEDTDKQGNGTGTPNDGAETTGSDTGESAEAGNDEEATDAQKEQETEAKRGAGYLWWLLGVLAAAVAGGIVWITGRRKRHEEEE